jgi:hypothetical protein
VVKLCTPRSFREEESERKKRPEAFIRLLRELRRRMNIENIVFDSRAYGEAGAKAEVLRLQNMGHSLSPKRSEEVQSLAPKPKARACNGIIVGK